MDEQLLRTNFSSIFESIDRLKSQIVNPPTIFASVRESRESDVKLNEAEVQLAKNMLNLTTIWLRGCVPPYPSIPEGLKGYVYASADVARTMMDLAVSQREDAVVRLNPRSSAQTQAPAGTLTFVCLYCVACISWYRYSYFLLVNILWLASHVCMRFPFIPCSLTILIILLTGDMNAGNNSGGEHEEDGKLVV
jgi:hypothetical protein